MKAKFQSILGLSSFKISPFLFRKTAYSLERGVHNPTLARQPKFLRQKRKK